MAEIEQAALSDDPLANTLRKCIVLGGRAGSTDLRDWATRELRGYGGDDELPAYRKVAAPIKIDGATIQAKISGQQIGPRSLPDFAQEHIAEQVELRDGVGPVEMLAADAEKRGDSSIRLSLPMGADLARYMNSQSGDQTQQIVSIYWDVSIATIRGVVDQVRTTVAELVGELRAGMGGQDQVPSAEITDQAVNVAVYGHKARVTVTAAQSGTQGASTAGDQRDALHDEPFWNRSRKAGAVIVGVATVVAAIVAVAQWIA